VRENANVSRRRSTVARQILVLQVLVVVAVVVGGVTLAYADARRAQIAGARDQALAVAQSVADTPDVRRALGSANPSAALQPYAEEVRRDSHTDFVVVMGLDRTRYSHPNPALIGKKFIGDLGGAPDGKVFSQEYTGTLGRSMRAVVPVRDGDRVVALVAVGITLEKIGEALRDRLVPIGLAAALILALGALGAWLCGAASASPAWPKSAPREIDGGESLAPRAAARAIAAVENERPSERASEKPEAPAAAAPASATPTTPAATPATPAAEEPIMTDEIVIEIED